MYYYIVLCRTRRKRPLSPQLHHSTHVRRRAASVAAGALGRDSAINARAMSVPSAAQQHSSTALVALGRGCTGGCCA